MTAFPGFCILAVVRGVPWGAGRRANPTQATARLCVGGASRRFRLRQSGPAGDGRQSQPRGQRPRRAGGDAPTLHRRWPRPRAGKASRRFRLRRPDPAGGGATVPALHGAAAPALRGKELSIASGSGGRARRAEERQSQPRTGRRPGLV